MARHMKERTHLVILKRPRKKLSWSIKNNIQTFSLEWLNKATRNNLSQFQPFRTEIWALNFQHGSQKIYRRILCVCDLLIVKINIKLFFWLIKHHVMKTYRESAHGTTYSRPRYQIQASGHLQNRLLYSQRSRSESRWVPEPVCTWRTRDKSVPPHETESPVLEPVAFLSLENDAF